MTSREALTFVVAQAPQPDDPGGQGEDFGKSSPVGLLLLLVLLIGVCLLVWSMTRHLRRLPERFDQERAEAAAPARARSGATTAAGSADGNADGGDPDGGGPDGGAADGRAGGASGSAG
ncbi:hypothetical protein [Salinifilum ghardaiensis]